MKVNSGVILEELQIRLQLPVCLSRVWLTLKAWGIVLKKSSTQQNRSGETPLLENPALTPPVDRLVIIAETGARTKMARLYG